MEVSGKRNQENGPKAENGQTERAAGLGKRTGHVEKWDQTESPSIPDICCMMKSIMYTVCIAMCV